jgi:hypothetical protein
MRDTIQSVLAVALVASATACSGLTDINTNPNGPVDVPPPSILAGALRSVVGGADGVDGVTSLNIRGGGLWVQYYAEIQYRDEDKYIVRPGTSGGWGLYNGPLEDFQRMIDKGVATNTPNWAAVGRIMKSYTFSVMTDAMGDIPYSEALKGGSLLTPQYDTQQAIYTDLLAQLTQASQEIDSAGIGFKTGDIMYGGNMTRWRKFANSLRLRLAMHLANVAPTTAAAEAQAAVTAGVFGTNADNAQLLYLAASPNQNPIYTDVHLNSRDDYGLSKTYVDSLTHWNDPRLPIFAQLNTDTIPIYEGLPNGLNNGEGPNLSHISRIGAYWRETPDAPLALLTYSEVLFLEAEAAQRGWIAGDPATFYAAAIQASMEQYGVDPAAITTYLAQAQVQYNVATGLTQIAYQKWVSLFMQGMEAWTEVRRTGVPALVPGPRVVGFTGIPERLPYDDQEQVLNKANVDAAVAAQGFFGSTDLKKPLWFTGR